MSLQDQSTITVLVRGLSDVASAVAHQLHLEGYAAAIHNGAEPPRVHRRRMAFADAFFDGQALLSGVEARRLDRIDELARVLRLGSFVPVVLQPLDRTISAISWAVLVDARMRKRAQPEDQRGLSRLAIGLGPNFVAGGNVDLAIETRWGDELGTIVTSGATQPLSGEPRPIQGVGRERVVYAPCGGLFSATAAIGSAVSAGDVIGRIGAHLIVAPLSGTVRGLTHDGVTVDVRDKIAEVDPRPIEKANFEGLGERPKRIAVAVLKAVEAWAATSNSTPGQLARQV